MLHCNYTEQVTLSMDAPPLDRPLLLPELPDAVEVPPETDAAPAGGDGGWGGGLGGLGGIGIGEVAFVVALLHTRHSTRRVSTARRGT